jgi:hypothetical protein
MLKIVKASLIFLLIFVSVVIIWIGLKEILNYNPDKVTIGKYNSDLKILQVGMINYENISIKIKKTSYQEEIEGVDFVIYDKDNSEMINYQVSLQELEDKNFQTFLSIDNTSKVSRIVISPIILSKSGEQIVGNPEDEYKVSGAVIVFNPPKKDLGYAEETVRYCNSADDCKDNDSCTSGACSNGLCSYPKIPNCKLCSSALECNDNDLCTENLCSEGRCSYHPIESCKSCEYTFQCEDNNKCTKDACIENGCSYTAIENCTV